MAPLDDDGAAELAEATARALGIAVDPDWRAAVVANLKAISAAAALVEGFPLDDGLDPAPVFRP